MDRTTFVRVWVSFTLVAATAHLALWCAAYLAVVSTWNVVVPPGYGLASLASNASSLIVNWLWYAGSAGLAGLALAATCRRLTTAPWFSLAVLLGGGLGAAFTALAGRTPADTLQAAVLSGLSAAIAAVLARRVISSTARTLATA